MLSHIWSANIFVFSNKLGFFGMIEFVVPKCWTKRICQENIFIMEYSPRMAPKVRDLKNVDVKISTSFYLDKVWILVGLDCGQNSVQKLLAGDTIRKKL